jgi:hypothetical protein
MGTTLDQYSCFYARVGLIVHLWWVGTGAKAKKKYLHFYLLIIVGGSIHFSICQFFFLIFDKVFRRLHILFHLSSSNLRHYLVKRSESNFIQANTPSDFKLSKFIHFRFIQLLIYLIHILDQIH